MDDSHRVKIQNSNILNALIEHVEGKREMSGTQVTAGIALMKKVLPDLSQVDVRGAGENGEHLHKVNADEAFSRFVSRLASVDATAASSSDGKQ
jgi:hypothetical protein